MCWCSIAKFLKQIDRANFAFKIFQTHRMFSPDFTFHVDGYSLSITDAKLQINDYHAIMYMYFGRHCYY